MNNDQNTRVDPESGREPAVQPLSQPSPQDHQLAEVPSDAAVRRRQEILFGPRLFAADSTWDLLELGALCGRIMLSLEKEIRRRARRHRDNPCFISAIGGQIDSEEV